MKAILVFVTALPFFAGSAHAIPTTWELLFEDMAIRGTFLLDIDTESTSSANIGGDFGFYTVSSRTYLNTGNFVGPFRVNNYMNFFSTETGQVYRTDYGDGQYNELKVNEVALEIGTMSGVLLPGGGLYQVYINEIYNYDETDVTCAYFDELYDPDTGEYIGQGACLYYDAYTNYNVDSGYWYGGYLRSLPVTAEVPATATAWLLLLALFGLRIGRSHPRGFSRA